MDRGYFEAILMKNTLKTLGVKSNVDGHDLLI
jgi:hypothetical protein